MVARCYEARGFRYFGISDCYRIVPWVDFYYACDHRWWDIHYSKVMEWGGSRNGYWCTEHRTKQARPDLHWIKGSGKGGISTDPSLIHYGGNSGFQLINCASLAGIRTMILVGYNMMVVDKQQHFFGPHPQGLSRSTSYQGFARAFESIDPHKHGLTIINATQPTALKAFPQMSLDDAINAALAE